MAKQRFIFFSLFFSALSLEVLGATTTTMGTFSAFDLENGYSYTDGEPTDITPNISFATAGISGLSKFDPSLGTLNKITVNADFDYKVTSTIEVYSVLDDELPLHSASFNPDSSGFEGERSYAMVRYKNGSSRFFITEEFFTPSIACEGSALTCSNSVMETFSFDSPLDILNTPPKSGQVASGLIDINDFVGTGLITALEMAINIPDGSVWEANNVFEAEGLVEVAFTSGTVSIEYDYAPAVVPVPAAVWLFISAVGGLFGMQRTKARMGA